MTDSFAIMNEMLTKMGVAATTLRPNEEVYELREFAGLYAQASIAESLLRIADALEVMNGLKKKPKGQPYIGVAIIGGKPTD